MKLKNFLTRTATSPVLALRRALSNALSEERPRTRESYGRFYERVVAGLDGAPDTDCGPHGESRSLVPGKATRCEGEATWPTDAGSASIL